MLLPLVAILLAIKFWIVKYVGKDGNG